jgi:hypothetical protein
VGANFDKLNQELSVYLRDYVVAAADDGDSYASADRSMYLNRAQNSLWGILYSIAKSKSVLQDLKIQLLSDHSVTETFTSDAAGVISVTGKRMVEVINMVREDTKHTVKFIPIKDVSLLSSSDPKWEATLSNLCCYFSSPAQLKIVPASEAVSKNFIVGYLRSPDTSLVAGSGSDILWQEAFWNDLRTLALAHALVDKGNYEALSAIEGALVAKYGVGLAEGLSGERAK